MAIILYMHTNKRIEKEEKGMENMILVQEKSNI